VRVLAIDHGIARCGCAISDPTGTIVRPLDVVEPPDLDQVAALARDEGAERVVVGLPLSLDGSEGEQAAIVRRFCEALGARLDVPVDAWDERLTTAMAGASRRSGARAAEDSLAAAHLLESYLASTTEPEAPREEQR
jgi:putative Holliday junction resolvase